MQNVNRLLLMILIANVMATTAHPQAPTTAPSTSPTTRPVPRNLGIVLMDLRQYEGADRQIQDLGGHLMVNGVSPGSRAERMGLRPGDVIKRMNGRDVSTVEDVISLVKTEPVLEIEILRRNEPLVLKEAGAGSANAHQ